MNELFTDLDTNNERIANVLAYGLRNLDKEDNIIQILEKYDIKILNEVKKNMDEYRNALFNIIIERRIKLKKDEDDTQNLANGMESISSGVEKINKIIERKQKAIKNKNPRNITIVVFLIIVVALIVGLIVTK